MPPVKRKKTSSRKPSPPRAAGLQKSAAACSEGSLAGVGDARSEAVGAKRSTPRVAPPLGESTTAASATPPEVGACGTPQSMPPLTPTDIADQLHSAAIHLLRRVRLRDRESGIGPAQLSALSVLVFGGPKSLGELANAEQVRPPTMSRIVAGLQRSGLIRRHTTEDGRRVRLEASPKGVSLMWEARKRRVESLAKAVDGLPENEREQIREALALLQQIMRNL